MVCFSHLHAGARGKYVSRLSRPSDRGRLHIWVNACRSGVYIHPRKEEEGRGGRRLVVLADQVPAHFIHVLPDEGHGDFIIKKIRAMRRFHYVASAFGDGSLDRKAENIVEDASDRRSGHAFFIQLADLNAYAAFRKTQPRANFDEEIWDKLGDTRLSEVNRNRPAPPGIVLWPQ